MATEITLETFAFIQTVPTVKVSLRKSWEDAWIEFPYIDCMSLRMGVGQQIDQATLKNEFGLMHRDGKASPSIESPINAMRYFCKVEVEPDSAPVGDIGGIVWYGVIVSENRDRFGGNDGGELQAEDGAGLDLENGDPINVGGTNAGTQVFTAFGLEWLLTRVFINKSVIERADGTGDFEIDRVIPFNSGTRQQLDSLDVKQLGNKAEGQPRFVRRDKVPTATIWTAFDIIRYLFDVFPPCVEPKFELHATVETHTAWWSQNNILLGPTLYDALNELINQRRGLTWSLEVDALDPSPIIYLRVHAFTHASITLGDSSIPANDQQVSLDDSAMKHISVLQVNDTSRKFEQVIAYGARRGSCFTLGVEDGTLVPGWADYQLEAYCNAAAGVTPPAEQKRQADSFRSTDAMANVLTRFLVPNTAPGTSWTGKSADGRSGTASTATCPKIFGSFGGTPGELGVDQTTFQDYWLAGLRVESWIPLRENVDYQTSASDPLNSNESHILPPYRKPFALYKLPGSDKYVRADRANVLVANELVTTAKTGIKFSAFVHPTTDQFGVNITPSTLAHAHANNTDITTILPTFDATTDTRREADWKTAIVTVYAEFDELVKQVYPYPAMSGSNNQQSKLEIHVGSSARLDYLVPNTVLDILENGELVKHTGGGGFLRDDRQKLLNIAKSAWQWYSTTRTALTINVQHITNQFKVGQLIRTLSGDDVNSLVTYITYDFTNMTTTINTEFAEVDPLGLFV